MRAFWVIVIDEMRTHLHVYMRAGLRVQSEHACLLRATWNVNEKCRCVCVRCRHRGRHLLKCIYVRNVKSNILILLLTLLRMLRKKARVLGPVWPVSQRNFYYTEPNRDAHHQTPFFLGFSAVSTGTDRDTAFTVDNIGQGVT